MYDEDQVIYMDPDFVKNDRSGRWRDAIAYAMPAIVFFVCLFFSVILFPLQVRWNPLGAPCLAPVLEEWIPRKHGPALTLKECTVVVEELCGSSREQQGLERHLCGWTRCPGGGRRAGWAFR